MPFSHFWIKSVLPKIFSLNFFDLFVVTTRVAVIPKNAYNIDLDVGVNIFAMENENVTLFIRDGYKRKHQVLFDSLIVEGTLFRFRRFENRVTISGKGPTMADVIVSVS